MLTNICLILQCCLKIFLYLYTHRVNPRRKVISSLVFLEIEKVLFFSKQFVLKISSMLKKIPPIFFPQKKNLYIFIWVCVWPRWRGVGQVILGQAFHHLSHTVSPEIQNQSFFLPFLLSYFLFLFLCKKPIHFCYTLT